MDFIITECGILNKPKVVLMNEYNVLDHNLLFYV